MTLRRSCAVRVASGAVTIRYLQFNDSSSMRPVQTAALAQVYVAGTALLLELKSTYPMLACRC